MAERWPAIGNRGVATASGEWKTARVTLRQRLGDGWFIVFGTTPDWALGKSEVGRQERREAKARRRQAKASGDFYCEYCGKKGATFSTVAIGRAFDSAICEQRFTQPDPRSTGLAAGRLYGDWQPGERFPLILYSGSRHCKWCGESTASITKCQFCGGEQ